MQRNARCAKKSGQLRLGRSCYNSANATIFRGSVTTQWDAEIMHRMNIINTSSHLSAHVPIDVILHAHFDTDLAPILYGASEPQLSRTPESCAH
jgi:hypothetical protein